MKTIKGYNKIRTKNKLFGLEFFDLLILVLIYMVVFIFSANLLVNLVIIGAAYFALRVYKRGKPPHWTGSVIRFVIRPKNFPVKRELEKDTFKK